MAFEARDLRELLRALAEDPETRLELVRLIGSVDVQLLAEETRKLAEAQQRTEQQLTALTQHVEALAEAQRSIEERIDRLAEAQRRTEEQLAALIAQVSELVNQMAQMQGELLELRYRDRAPAYFAPIARRLRVLGYPELDRMLDEAVEAGRLSEEESDDVRLADLFLVGRRRPDGKIVYLVVETAATVRADDVERAFARAALFSRTGVEAWPVVAGRRTDDQASSAALRTPVWRVVNGKADPPATTNDATGA